MKAASNAETIQHRLWNFDCNYGRLRHPMGHHRTQFIIWINSVCGCFAVYFFCVKLTWFTIALCNTPYTIILLCCLVFLDAQKVYLTTFFRFRISYSMMYMYHLSIQFAHVNQNDMKRIEYCPLIYPATPEAYINRTYNKYGRLAENNDDFENPVYIYSIMSAYMIYMWGDLILTPHLKDQTPGIWVVIDTQKQCVS
jgi:uncharacterized protein (UPF0305 family)